MKRVLLVSAVVMAFMFFLLGSTVKAQDFCKGNFDYDKDVDGTDAATFKQDFGRSAFLDPCPPDGPAPVERTGQSQIYTAGDDGYYQRGVSWTVNRFTDNGNGTVTDNLTGLIWLKNANCVGLPMSWDLAMQFSSGVCDGVCGLTDGSKIGDWRLPNKRELISITHDGCHSPAVPNTTGTGCWSAGDPFTNVQYYFYWSSTTNVNLPDTAWNVHFGWSGVGAADKDGIGMDGYVWPVRGGHPY